MRYRLLAAGALAALGMLAVAPAAGAEPSAVGPFDYSGAFTTPLSPGAWTTDLAKPLLLSPYGAGGRIECTAFHGYLIDCTQYDPTGVGHQLVQLVGPGYPPLRTRELWVFNPFA